MNWCPSKLCFQEQKLFFMRSHYFFDKINNFSKSVFLKGWLHEVFFTIQWDWRFYVFIISLSCKYLLGKFSARLSQIQIFHPLICNIFVIANHFTLNALRATPQFCHEITPACATLLINIKSQKFLVKCFASVKNTLTFAPVFMVLVFKVIKSKTSRWRNCFFIV